MELIEERRTYRVRSRSFDVRSWLQLSSRIPYHRTQEFRSGDPTSGERNGFRSEEAWLKSGTERTLRMGLGPASPYRLPAAEPYSSDSCWTGWPPLRS